MIRIHSAGRHNTRLYFIPLLAALAVAVATQPAFAAASLDSSLRSPDDEPSASSAPTSELTGTVYDAAGLPLIGAIVAVILPGGAQSIAVSDAQGQFVIRNLPPGMYTLVAQSLGFVSAMVTGVVVPRQEPLALQLRAEPELASLLSAAAPLDLGWAFRSRVRDVLRQTEPTEAPAGVVEESSPRQGTVQGGNWVSESDLLGPANLGGELSLLTVAPFTTSAWDAGSTTAVSLGSRRDDGTQGWFLQAQVADRGFVRARSDFDKLINGNHAVRLGVGYAAQDLSPVGLSGGMDRIWVGSLAAEDRWQLGKPFIISYGLRFEHYNYVDQAAVVSPRIEVAYAPVESLTLRSGVYYDAEAPGLAELSFEIDPLSVRYVDILTTEGIEPERAMRYEFGVEKTMESTELSARAYYDEISDELMGVYLAGPSGRSSYMVMNLGDAVASGFEVDFRRTFLDRLAGHVTYSYGWRTGADVPTELAVESGLVGAPRLGPEAAQVDTTHELSAGVETVLGAYETRLLATYLWKHGYPVLRGGDFGNVYERIDLRVRQPLPFHAFSSEWSALVQVQNLLGQRYDGIFDLHLNDVPILSRIVAGGLAVRF